MKIVFLTGSGDIPKCTEAMKFGAIDFLEKPFAYPKLLAAIKNALSHEEKMLKKELSAGDAKGRYQSLTRREKEVFEGIVKSLTSAQIAEQQGVKISTTLMHRKHMLRKLDLHSVSEVHIFAGAHKLQN
jgi:FixJ family two-component response regulator